MHSNRHQMEIMIHRYKNKICLKASCVVHLLFRDQKPKFCWNKVKMAGKGKDEWEVAKMDQSNKLIQKYTPIELGQEAQ